MLFGLGLGLICKGLRSLKILHRDRITEEEEKCSLVLAFEKNDNRNQTSFVFADLATLKHTLNTEVMCSSHGGLFYATYE